METLEKNFCRSRNYFFFPLLLIGFFVISAIVMLLWNLIIPAISPLTSISYWQAMGLFVLSRILFGGVRFARHHHGHRHPFTHKQFKAKFMDMTEEERQQFRNQWKKRCC
jgi:hypothetical protein